MFFTCADAVIFSPSGCQVLSSPLSLQTGPQEVSTFILNINSFLAQPTSCGLVPLGHLIALLDPMPSSGIGFAILITCGIFKKDIWEVILCGFLGFFFSSMFESILWRSEDNLGIAPRLLCWTVLCQLDTS